MKLKQQALRTALTWGILGLFMLVSRPDKLPVVVLIVPFVLLFIALMSLSGLLQALYHRYGTRGKADRLGWRLRVTVCISLVLVLVLQSLGQLTLRDVATIVAIAIIGYLYVGRGLIEPKKR